MHNKTRINAKSGDGRELALQHQTSDVPILPAAEYLEKVERLQPGITKWMMDKTSREADARRQLNLLKVNSFHAAQRRGQNYGLAFGLCVRYHVY